MEMFADAIEASANDRTPRVPSNVTYLQGADEIIKFMEKRKKTDAADEYFIVLNIREYLENDDGRLGEDKLFQILSGFSCPLNPDVELFLKRQSVEFAKKHQAVTYETEKRSVKRKKDYLVFQELRGMGENDKDTLAKYSKMLDAGKGGCKKSCVYGKQDFLI